MSSRGAALRARPTPPHHCPCPPRTALDHCEAFPALGRGRLGAPSPTRGVPLTSLPHVGLGAALRRGLPWALWGVSTATRLYLPNASSTPIPQLRESRMSPDIPGVSWGQNGPSSRTDDLDALCEGPSRAPKRYHSVVPRTCVFVLPSRRGKQDLVFPPVCLRGVHCQPHSGQNLAQPPS